MKKLCYIVITLLILCGKTKQEEITDKQNPPVKETEKVEVFSVSDDDEILWLSADVYKGEPIFVFETKSKITFQKGVTGELETVANFSPGFRTLANPFIFSLGDDIILVFYREYKTYIMKRANNNWTEYLQISGKHINPTKLKIHRGYETKEIIAIAVISTDNRNISVIFIEDEGTKTLNLSCEQVCKGIPRDVSAQNYKNEIIIFIVSDIVHKIGVNADLDIITETDININNVDSLKGYANRTFYTLNKDKLYVMEGDLQLESAIPILSIPHYFGFLRITPKNPDEILLFDPIKRYLFLYQKSQSGSWASKDAISGCNIGVTFSPAGDEKIVVSDGKKAYLMTYFQKLGAECSDNNYVLPSGISDVILSKIKFFDDIPSVFVSTRYGSGFLEGSVLKYISDSPLSSFEILSQDSVIFRDGEAIKYSDRGNIRQLDPRGYSLTSSGNYAVWYSLEGQNLYVKTFDRNITRVIWKEDIKEGQNIEGLLNPGRISIFTTQSKVYILFYSPFQKMYIFYESGPQKEIDYDAPMSYLYLDENNRIYLFFVDYEKLRIFDISQNKTYDFVLERGTTPSYIFFFKNIFVFSDVGLASGNVRSFKFLNDYLIELPRFATGSYYVSLSYDTKKSAHISFSDVLRNLKIFKIW